MFCFADWKHESVVSVPLVLLLPKALGLVSDRLQGFISSAFWGKGTFVAFLRSSNIHTVLLKIKCSIPNLLAFLNHANNLLLGLWGKIFFAASKAGMFCKLASHLLLVTVQMEDSVISAGVKFFPCQICMCLLQKRPKFHTGNIHNYAPGIMCPYYLFTGKMAIF